MSSTGDNNQTGTVFNIQKYAVHDGPGIRTLVFLKGCPLRCAWCSNPESQSPMPELGFNPDKCLTLEKCIRCVEVCTCGALIPGADGRLQVDRNVCSNCLHCATVCPTGALTVYGQSRRVGQVLDRVEEDGVFYSRSGGGLTLSGGEPFFQGAFATALLREAKRRRIGTAVETCGYCDQETLEQALPYVDQLLFDIKSVNPESHRSATGKSCRRILENLRFARERFPALPIRVRTPVIPGFNDTEDEITGIVEQIRGMKNIEYELLPYHRLGTPKYGYLGRTYPMEGAEPLSDERLAPLRSLAVSL